MRSFLLLLFLNSLLSLGLTNATDAGESLEYVTKECSNKLKGIDSIEKFELFSRHYKNLVTTSEKPKRGLFNLDSRLRKCYDLREALLELETIVVSRHSGVCQMGYIDRLVRYHQKYLQSKSQTKSEVTKDDSPVGSESSYIARFFSLFAHQVASTCKSKLASRLEEAQNKHDCSVVLSGYLPSDISDEEDQDVSAISQFLNQFKKVEDFRPILKIAPSGENGFYYDVVVPQEIVEKIENLKSECRLREPHYSALFTPVATLAGFGYSLEDASSDPGEATQSKATRVLKCWLATAQLCQGILQTHPIIGDDELAEEKRIAIKFGNAPADVASPVLVDKSLEFVDTFDDISPEVVGFVRRKFTTMSKIKRKGYKILKSFIERHIDMDSLEKGAVQKFMQTLTIDSSNMDSRVAFSGKENNGGQFNPATLFTDDADSFLQMAGFFVSHSIALIFNCIVGVSLSAVFVWFSLYSWILTIRQRALVGDEQHMKADWRKIREEKMIGVRNKFEKNSYKDHLKVYKSD